MPIEFIQVGGACGKLLPRYNGESLPPLIQETRVLRFYPVRVYFTCKHEAHRFKAFMLALKQVCPMA